MTDEELCKGLRLLCFIPTTQAADRIEALTVENAYLERVVKYLSDEENLAEQEACMVENDFIKAEKEIEALTAKLAKAVEGLDKAAALIEDRHVVHMTSKGRNPKDYISDWSLIAKEVRALLAEIEGEK
jgi:hypothetical protein